MTDNVAAAQETCHIATAASSEAAEKQKISDTAELEDETVMKEIQQLCDGIREPPQRLQVLQLLRSFVAVAPSRNSAATPITLERPAAVSRGRVLLVDDDSDVLVSVGGFLEAENMDVLRCGNGADALAVLMGGEPINAVVTDIMMPGMSGIAFLTAARQIRPHLPALVITGFSKFIGSEELPANICVLLKPFRRREFVTELKRLLASKEVNAAGNPR